MTHKEINIRYTEFRSLDEMPEQDRLLAESAISATANSYSPYSGFRVGAAVRLSNGETICGSNQENIAYPSGLCAERTAMFYAHSKYPEAVIEEIALAGVKNGNLCKLPVSPCGACRQVMAEYQVKSGRQMKIILAGAEAIYVFEKVEDILPLVFDSL